MAGKNFSQMTKEELREAGRKGGKASAGVQQRKRERAKEMKATFASLLSMTIKGGKVYDTEEIENFSQLKGKNITVNEAICVRQVQKALMGDSKAFEFIRDMMGEKPVDTVQIKDITPVIIAGEDEIKD